MKQKITILILATFTIFFLLANNARADLNLRSISYDPAIIAAGDEVDIVIQFDVNNMATGEQKIGNPDYKFEATLHTDDTLTEKYVVIEDSKGDNIQGSLFTGDIYNRKYRVRVTNDALPGNYEFRLEGQWYHNEEPIDSTEYIRFKMPVKKEGIIIDVNTINTIPSDVRPGDNNVEIKTFIENVGEKDAKSLEINLIHPEGIESSYTNNNRLWIGRLNAGESKEIKFYVDIDEDAKAETYNLNYNFDYMDLDNNKYSSSRELPFIIKERPYLKVSGYSGEGLSGGKSKLYVKIKNYGEESAESVDVRILKQNSQPFVIDVRSDFIGELKPGEEGTAIFNIAINKDAQIKEHDIKLIIRAKGDSDEGDDNIYTFNRRAKFEVIGEKPNTLLYIGLTAFAFILIYIIAHTVIRHISHNKTHKKQTGNNRINKASRWTE